MVPWRWTILVLGCGLALTSPAALAADRMDQILDRFVNANANRDHVMIVAHRGGWMVDGRIVVAENSIAALERAYVLGVEMIGVDVRLTGDDRFVILHDETIDRTTTCTDADMSFAEVRRCNLVIEGTREVTAEVVPSLEELFEAAAGRILINLDTKVSMTPTGRMLDIAREMGVERQVVVTAAAHDAEQLDAGLAVRKELGGTVGMMPNIYDSRIENLEPAVAALKLLAPEVLQTRNEQAHGAPPTTDGGIMYSAHARALAVAHDAHLWIDTFYTTGERPSGFRAGGRGDELAVLADLPHEVLGFWAERGATMIQTDEPAAAIAWLEANGYRRPYD